MSVLELNEYLKLLMDAPRPGAENYLAFYDSRLDAICKDPRALLIPLDDHLCHRGDGLFESLSYREGRLLALEAHLQRMQEGAKALGLKPPKPWPCVRELIISVASASGESNGDLRVFLSRGPGGFGVSPSECPNEGLYIVALRKKVVNPDIYQKGVTAFTSEIPPKQAYLARIKNTNYLPNVFMAREAEQKGKDVAVSFSSDGVMGEAAVANLAIIDQNGRFLCPQFDHILPGTTLIAAMDLLKAKLTVCQGPIRHEDIFSAKEVLLLTSSSLCLAVTEFDGQKVGSPEHCGQPGPMSHWLRQELLARLYDEGVPLNL